MKTWRTAILGTGFVGRVHLEALRRLGNVEVCAIANPHLEKARKLADELSVKRVEPDYRVLLDDPALDAVHVCTPNALHLPMAKAAFEKGKHVVCEKPLTTTVEAARELVALAHSSGLRNCLCHNLRYYPMVQHVRRLVEGGELGEILVVQGTYSQDWLLYDTDWNWRVLAGEGGPSRSMADIGSHWFDMVEHVTGLQVTSLCADLQIFHRTRKQPKGPIETFAGKLLQPDDYTEVPVDTEDFGAAVFRMGDRTRGSMTASQVSAGCKNQLRIEIYGSKGSASWNQERPDELWLGRRNENNQVLIKDPSLLHPASRPYADLPGGHSEGYDDTFKQVFRRFYASLENPGAQPEYPQFADGLRQLRILQTVLESSRSRSWKEVPGD
jgi:predicted dehydrogenase